MNILIGDIGNTITKICLVKINNFKLNKIIYIDSNKIKSTNFLKKNIARIIKGKLINKVALFSSVVPKYQSILKKLLKKNYKIISLDENLVNWRKLNNSLSSSIIQKLSDGFKVYNSYMNYNYITSLYLLLCLCINFLKKND